ncbi:MAG: hypothetical protein HY706_02945 [Candidatus Hydrogenedentes bacterium]|nr:hypothetical protein [Candidatus Hydrogenedentota bacterium]
MLITTGRVRHGTIELDDQSLPEGTIVTVLSAEGNESFALSPDEEAMLSAAIEEAERGDSIPASQLLRQIRKS